MEVIVVVNGTTDRTAAVARGYMATYPQLRVLEDPRRIGKGGAVMLGFRESRGELVGFVDADGATPPAAFQDLLEHRGNAGAIIASRWCKGADVQPPQPLRRQIASRLFNLLTHLLFGLPLTDTQCGAKLFRRDVVEAIMPRLGLTRWAFDVDMLFQCKRDGVAVKEIPTTWHDVAGSKVQVMRTSIDMLLALGRLRLIYSPLAFVVRIYDHTLAPLIHPKGGESDRMLEHSLLLLVGGQVANVCNMLFTLVMIRLLGQVEYGQMAAMLQIVVFTGIPLGSVGATMTHFTATAIRDGARDYVAPMASRMMLHMTFVLLPFTLLLVSRSTSVATGMGLDGVLPVAVTIAAIVISFYRPIFGGALAGAQAFHWGIGVSLAWSVTRLILGVLFAMLGWGVNGALFANLLAVVAGLACGWWGARGVFGPSRSSAPPMKPLYSYMGLYSIGLLGFAMLTQTDIVLVKKVFPELEAGQYAQAVTVARMVFFLPLPIAAAMFPKVSGSRGEDNAGRRLFWKGLLMTGLLSVAVVGVCLVLPGFLMRFLAGVDATAEQLRIVRVMALAQLPVGIMLYVMRYLLARKRHAANFAIVAGGACYWVIARRAHDPMGVVLALGLGSLLALGLMGIDPLVRRTRGHRAKA